jgi:alkanesulfonate monooxygenase SsuD/methylene tetrahydromethanopterin reductase-like flavin-dependent oxidoreductase (luciferase family)
MHGSETFDYPDTGVVLPENTSMTGTELVELATEAVDAGFDSIWCSEEWGYNAFALLARINERVRCTLGTSVVSAFSRTPSTLAASALTLQEGTDDGFILGIGSGTPEIVEGFHGSSFDRPIQRIRETLEIIDLGLSGQRINFDGDSFSPEGFVLNHNRERRVPVFNAAVGPTNIAMSLEYADGIMPHLLPISAIEDAIPRDERASGSERLRVYPVVPTTVGTDSEAAKRTLSEYVAYCIGSTHVFYDVLSTHGFEDTATRIRDHWQREEPKRATEAVTDELLDEVGIAGTASEARQRLEEINSNVDGVLVAFPHEVDQKTVRRSISALA